VKTYLPKIDLKKLGEPNSNAIDFRGWRIVDADGQVLGRLAEKIANVLRGRDKPTFTPHLDGGDFVIVINAEKVRVTGKKETNKFYSSYSGYRGGLKQVPLADIRAKHPELLIMKAVKGMLPKNRLAAKLLTKLKVYSGSDHPHAAQNPEPLIPISK
jgi:large subunit ribosomal protein L13